MSTLIPNQFNIYEPLEEVQSIVSTLVENIYHDSSYQDYLKDLKDSDTTITNKKLDAISKTFTDIQVFNTNKNPLFLLNDIGIILGVSNISAMVKNYTEIEKITGILVINNKPIKKIFLTKNGVYRIMFNNRSKLSNIFRAFIYKLLDHMEINGKDLTRELMNEIHSENPEMINEAITEYNDNLARYKQLYESELMQKEMLELTITNNNILFKDIEDEKNEIEIKQNYNIMYIEQLKKEKRMAFEKIYNIKEDNNMDSTVVALEFMKKKFFKEFTISLVHPSIMSEVFKSKKFPVCVDYTADQYDSEFAFIMMIFNQSNRISDEEIFYLTVQLKGTEKESPLKHCESCKEVLVASDYIIDKTKFSEMIEIMKSECTHFYMPGSRKGSNNLIYQISIEHIKSIAKTFIA